MIAHTACGSVRVMRGPLCVLGVAGAFAFAPALAAASTYCVGAVTSAPCIASFPANGAGLQAALDEADTNVDIGGTPDTVRIGPGNYEALQGFRTLGGDISIVGSGEATVLSSSGGTENDTVLELKAGGSPGVAVRELQVHLTGTRAEAIWDFREVTDVHIGGPGAIFDKGIRLPNGGLIARVLIDAAHVSGGSAAIVAGAGVIEDSVIRVSSLPSSLVRALGIFADASRTPGTQELTVRHVSLLGDGSARSTGLDSQGSRSEAGVTREVVHLRDTLVDGFEYAFERSGEAGTPSVGCEPVCFAGFADIESRYSSFAPTPVIEEGPGSFSSGPGDLADPPPNLGPDGSPQAGSPLIDAGDPAGAEAGESSTDLAGHPRILGARRDIGAFEAVPSIPAFPPSPSPSPTPTPETPGGGSSHLAPVISGLALSPTRFRTGRAPKRGARIHFSISAPAIYTLRIERVVGGRLLSSHGKPASCRPGARGAGRRCRLYRRRLTLSAPAAAGPVSIAFSGRRGSTRLRPGLYRLTAEARDSSGAVAQVRRIGFTILA